MNQSQAQALLDGLKTAYSSVDVDTWRSLSPGEDRASRERHDEVLFVLREFVRTHVQELDRLQMLLLPDEEHAEWADFPETDDPIYMSPWRTFWRFRHQPLIKCLYLVVGEGFTQHPECAAFEEELPRLISIMEERLTTLPVGDEAVTVASGAIVMSASLRAIWSEATRLPGKTLAHMRKLRTDGPSTYDHLSGAGNPDAVANALRPAKRIKLVEAAWKHGREHVWTLTELGQEFLSLYDKPEQ